MANIDQEFVEFVVKSLVNEPDKVQVERSIDEKGVLLQLTVGPEDLGRVIGKRGNTAQSIRTLLRALGTKNDARYNLKIVDPEGGERPQRERRSDNDSGDGFAAASAGAVGAAAVADDASVSAADDAVSASAPSDGASQWAHLSSSDDDSNEDNTTDENDDSDDSEENEDNQSSSVVEKTREELADLDGLDI